MLQWLILVENKAANWVPEATFLVIFLKLWFCQNRAPAVAGTQFLRVGRWNLNKIAGNNARKTRRGQQHQKKCGLVTTFFVPGAVLVKFGVLSGSQVATQNDTRVWGPLGTDASVATPDAHGVPFGGLGSPFHVFLEFSMLQWPIPFKFRAENCIPETSFFGKFS